MGKYGFDINKGKALIYEDDKGEFSLSPRGCFAWSLADTKISNLHPTELSETSDFDTAFKILVSRFEKYGFIDSGNTEVDNEHEPREIFIETVKGFYPNATDWQVNAAFDAFAIFMEQHGNTNKNEI